MPYKDVYELGVLIREQAAINRRKFEQLSEKCEFKIKPRSIKEPRYCNIKLMCHCSISGNAIKKECCMENCRALLE